MADAPKRAPHVKVVHAGCDGGGDPHSFVYYPDVADVKLLEVLEDGTERPMHMHSVSSVTWTAKVDEPTSLKVEYLGAAIEAEVSKSNAPALPTKPGQLVPFVDERYENDVEFKRIVDYFISFYADGRFSPSDLRCAATYAAILFEMRRATKFVYDPEKGELKRVESK